MFEKKKNTVETLTVATTETHQETSNLTHLALGIARDSKTSEWCVVEIGFNPETGETGDLKFVPAGPIKALASEQFKITAAHKELV